MLHRLRMALLCAMSLSLILTAYLSHIVPKTRRGRMKLRYKAATHVILSNWTSAARPRPARVPSESVSSGMTFPDQIAALSPNQCLPFYHDLQMEVNPPHQGPFSPMELQRRFGVVASPSHGQRQQQFRQGCARHPELWRKPVAANDSIIFVREKNTSFCLVEKAGSTFFKQILFVLYGKGGNFPLHSPFQLDFGLAHGLVTVQMMTSLSVIRRPGVRNVVMVRDPWSRLYSAYVNKFFLVNCPYWQMATGNLHFFRDAERRKTRPLGHDVTFAEFVRFVIGVGQEYDPHIMPHSRHECVSCDVNYAHIVRLESVGADLLRLLQDLGEAGPRPRMYFSDLKTESELYNLVAALCSLLETPDVVSQFLGPRQALQRVWRYMHLAGYADLHNEMPSDLHTRPHREVFRAFFDAFQRRSTHTASRQRTQARRQAFLSLSDLDLKKLKDIYQADFDLFGYEAEPNEIFMDRERKRAEAATQFQYFNLVE